MKFCRIVGARPQIMQAAMLRREIERRGHREILVHTGQHYDTNMSAGLFREMGLPEPDVNLGVGSAGHGAQTGRMLAALDAVIAQYSPDAVVVDGDTNSTLAGALAGAKLPLPLVHIEAGMRSHDRFSPEEINRVITDHVAELLCAPTDTAVENLRREGLSGRTVKTGDLLYDCFLNFRSTANDAVMDDVGVESGGFILATIHRAENTNNAGLFRAILTELSLLPLPVVFPVHPRVRSLIEDYDMHRGWTGSLRLIDPVPYREMLSLENNAQCIITDSGGVQREAYFTRTPCVVLRNNTEWTEQVDLGWSVLAPPGATPLLDCYRQALNTPGNWYDIYGQGTAAARIVTAMENCLS